MKITGSEPGTVVDEDQLLNSHNSSFFQGLTKFSSATFSLNIVQIETKEVSL